jgi:steroid delta-isomerase-like uncharacterized protein
MSDAEEARMETLMLDLVHDHLDAFSASDWRRFSGVLAPDVVLDDVGNNHRVVGAAGYLAAVQRWKRAFPELSARVLRTFAVGNTAMLEVEWSGRHLGPLDLGSMAIPATGCTISMRSAAFYAVSGRVIREARHYYDTRSLIAQLGHTTFHTPRRHPGRVRTTAPLAGASRR